MTRFLLQFPRWEEDILTKSRTLLHLPCDGCPEPHVGDSLMIHQSLDKHPSSPVAHTVIREVTQIRLIESLASGADWSLLNLPVGDYEAYSERWDRVNLEAPYKTNPLVWRIVFHYAGASPVFSLAV